jgi:hypothetical protein
MPPVQAFTLKIDKNVYPCVQFENFLTCGINPQTYGREIVEAYNIWDFLNEPLGRNNYSELCLLLTFKKRFCIFFLRFPVQLWWMFLEVTGGLANVRWLLFTVNIGDQHGQYFYQHVICIFKEMRDDLFRSAQP